MRGVDDDVAQRLVDIGRGVLVEADVLGIVERIQAYDENLRVTFLDPEQFSDIRDAPYQIQEICPDGMRRPVMSVWELDERVLERLYAADTQRFDVLHRLEGNNKKALSIEKRRYKEEVQAVSEMVQGVLASPKDTYTATNPVTGEKHKFTSIKQSDD